MCADGLATLPWAEAEQLNEYMYVGDTSHDDMAKRRGRILTPALGLSRGGKRQRSLKRLMASTTGCPYYSIMYMVESCLCLTSVSFIYPYSRKREESEEPDAHRALGPAEGLQRANNRMTDYFTETCLTSQQLRRSLILYTIYYDYMTQITVTRPDRQTPSSQPVYRRLFVFIDVL
jgi:hypothetical protein